MSTTSEISSALVHLLSLLTSSNNEQRNSAEESLNTTWIRDQPGNLLEGLANQVRVAEDAALRSFSAVLLRRIAPKDYPQPSGESGPDVWSTIQIHAREAVKSTLLAAFEQENNGGVRHKLSDLVAEISLLETDWPEIKICLQSCAIAVEPVFRESAFRVFGTNPELLGQAYTAQLRTILLSGLTDTDRTVQLAAVECFTNYLIMVPESTRVRLHDIVPALMNVLPPLLAEQDSESLTTALNILTELVEAHPKTFKALFSDLVSFCIAVIRNKALENAARQAALEVLITFAEGAPGMCRKDTNYTNDVTVECLSFMTDLGDDDETSEWLAADDLDADDNDENHLAGEQALDRLARKLGPKTLLPPAFTWLPKLIASDNWRERHAALMALSSIAEGCEKLMRQELEKVLGMVLPCLSDMHPRVRWAACNAVGQMCTDFSGDIQERFSALVLNALTPILDAQEARVATHAAAAFVNFCENADQNSLEPYLDPVLERLLGQLRRPQKYIQEQAVTTIATVADAAEKKFIKYYDSIMPLLLNVLRDAADDQHRLLRGKAMECATLIALAVGKEQFATQANDLINLLGTIQAQVHSADDPQSAYLMASWGRICKVLGSDFFPYLSAVMPPILSAAKSKPDFAVIHDESEKGAYSEDEGWEFFLLRGQQVGIKTSTLEDKNAAISILVLYAQEMKGHFATYAQEILKEIALPGLIFYYHDGVRTASASLIPELINCLKLGASHDSNYLIQAWSVTVTKLLDLMKSETNIEMLAAIYESFYESVEVLGRASLGESQLEAFVTSTEAQINEYMRREQVRTNDHKAGDVDLEQDEDVLYEMELDQDLLGEMSKALHVLFKHFHADLIPQFRRILPYLQKFSLSANAGCRQWSICVYDDLIEFCSPEAWQLREAFIQPLARGLSDVAPEVRQAAAYGIGCAAQHGGETFAELVGQSLSSLFAVLNAPDAKHEDNVYASDNACVAIAKICRFSPSKVSDLDATVTAWIKTMPVTHDEQDAPYAYRYLGELMDCGHAAIMSQLPLVVDIVAQALENAVITGQNLTNLLEATKTLFARLPAEAPSTLVSALPPTRQEVFAKHFR